MLAYCAGDPIERVFLEDVARRGHRRFRAVRGDDGLAALCYFGANVVPSGRGCWEFAGEAAHRATRDDHRPGGRGERALERPRSSCMPSPREDRPGQPVYVIEEPPEPGSSGLRAATLDDLDLLVPACALTHEEELGVDPLRRDPDGFRRRTRRPDRGGPLLALGRGRTRSCSRPRRPRGRRAPSSSSRSGSTRRRGGRATAPAGSRDLCRLLLERTPPSACSSAPRTRRRSALYEKIGMRQDGTYRSLLF